RTRRVELERTARAVRRQRPALLAELADIADVRATRAADLLRDPTTDLDELERTLSPGGAGIDPEALRAIAALTLPSEAEVTAVADRLAACGAEVDRHATAEAQADIRVLEL